MTHTAPKAILVMLHIHVNSLLREGLFWNHQCNAMGFNLKQVQRTVPILNEGNDSRGGNLRVVLLPEPEFKGTKLTSKDGLWNS